MTSWLIDGLFFFFFSFIIISTQAHNCGAAFRVHCCLWLCKLATAGFDNCICYACIDRVNTKFKRWNVVWLLSMCQRAPGATRQRKRMTSDHQLEECMTWPWTITLFSVCGVLRMLFLGHVSVHTTADIWHNHTANDSHNFLSSFLNIRSCNDR